VVKETARAKLAPFLLHYILADYVLFFRSRCIFGVSFYKDYHADNFSRKEKLLAKIQNSHYVPFFILHFVDVIEGVVVDVLYVFLRVDVFF
jgi:hypothetical protein